MLLQPWVREFFLDARIRWVGEAIRWQGTGTDVGLVGALGVLAMMASPDICRGGSVDKMRGFPLVLGGVIMFLSSFVASINSGMGESVHHCAPPTVCV